jgi:hypothetical protein
MLERVDRIQMAVAEAAPATRLFRDILGAGRPELVTH